MELSRKKGKGLRKYCDVVKDLITLQDLGFKEDEYNRWEYLVYHQKSFNPRTSKPLFYIKKFVASGDNLYLVEIRNGEYTSTILWNKKVSGEISRGELNLLMNLILKGNGKEEI